MAWQNHIHSETFTAAVDMSSGQFHIVELTSNLLEVDFAAANEGYGVLQNIPETGEAATVATEGQAKVIAGSGGLAIGDWVTSAASGFATAANSSATVKSIIGRALSTASSGGLATMRIERFTAQAL